MSIELLSRRRDWGTRASERELLPKNVRPVRYELCLEPDLDESFDFVGTVVIDLYVVQETSSITLHSLDLEILETDVFAVDGTTINVKSLAFDKSKETVTVHLNQSIRAPAKLQLRHKFTGSLVDHHGAGFFRSPIQDSGAVRWMASTQFEPTAARRAFPCFDEPALKARFDISLVAPRHLTCLSNMPVTKVQEFEALSTGKKMKKVIFATTPAMSTYIACFAVGELNFIETNAFRIPVRVYATKDKNIEHGRYALDLAARALEHFEKTFDVPFPLPKMDLIAIPGGQGGMENWGLVTFADYLLLLDPQNTAAQAWQHVASMVVHELAHQWFGNIVTMEFWDALWLNEGFATWAEIHAWQSLDPTWPTWQIFTVDQYQDALNMDSDLATHPIEVPVKRAGDIAQIFDAISYNKGCAILHMLSELLGERVFLKGVSLHLKRHSFGNAKTTDLWDALSAVSGKDVQSMMEVWTRDPGYPVLQVVEDAADGSITIAQNRFFQAEKAQKGTELLYPLALKIRHQNGISRKQLSSRKTQIEMPLGFYKVNADQSGFYRVAYSSERFLMLAQNAKDGLLSAEDRIGLVSDALALASNGSYQVTTSTLLALLERFDEETSFAVWKQVISVLSTILEAWSYESDQTITMLRAFKTRLVSKALARNGWEFGAGDKWVDQMLKARLFAAATNDPTSNEAAERMFKAYSNGDKSAINLNILEAVFAKVLGNDPTQEKYNTILEGCQDVSDINRRQICLKSLGYAQTDALMSQTLELAIKPEIVTRGEMVQVIEPLTGHAVGKAKAWEWFKANIKPILQAGGGAPGANGRVISLFTAKLCSREQWQDVRDFFQHQNTEQYKTYLEISLNKILGRAVWVERDRDEVHAWLLKNGYGA
ncbi:hypothetical protein BP6252_12010 [Coleophoma cylindrospora]|uniref:Aminopeptidase n=1 Tax=Coleophoma cylindrospora TaxID=1849047 RepID=A0A3D8QFX2_9HELO|nr:hypothetical protein BP6252_12010 [Coleophoma cylindrospora]